MHDLVDARRNRFFRGKRMRPEEFDVEQDYGLERRRLINRAVLGWGVVYGFQLSQPERLAAARSAEPVAEAPKADQPAPLAEPAPAKDRPARDPDEDDPEEEYLDDEAAAPETPAQQAPVPSAPEPPRLPEGPYPLEVSDGMGLDRLGREVVRLHDRTIGRRNTFLLASGEDGHLVARDLTKLETGGRYVLAVHYAEEQVGEAVPAHLCGCGRPERPYVRETAVFSLRPADKHEHKEGLAAKDDGDCGCGCAEAPCPDDCPDCVADACEGERRGPHARLGDWVAEREVAQPPSHLHSWGRFGVALHERIDLACITIEAPADDCDPLGVLSIDDATGPRRLVKNNDLLFDLIRGCDLTHISETSWSDWHRRGPDNPVKWVDFRGMFDRETEISHSEDIVTCRTEFVVSFSGLVKRASIGTDVVSMRVLPVEGADGTGWALNYPVPIFFVDSTPANGNPSSPLTDRMRIEVNAAWVFDEMSRKGLSIFRDEHGFYVEIEVRGDLIEDCSGLPVDANVRGLRAVPSGNGTPGGTYLSRFAVEAMPPRRRDPE